MKHLIVAFTAFIGFCSLAQAQVQIQPRKHPTLLQFRVVQGGEVLATPFAMVEQNIPAALEIEGVFRLEVRANSDDEHADVRIALYLVRPTELIQIGTPRVVGKLDEKISISFSDNNVVPITIEVLASKGARHEIAK